MKKIIFPLLCIVAISSTIYFSSHKSEQTEFLLNNIEALAADEHADITRCLGTGTLDCPFIHTKVKRIYGGYSLEELY